MSKLQFTLQVWIIIAILAYGIPTVLVYFLLLRPLFSEAKQAKEDSLATEEYMILKNTANRLTQFKERISTRNTVEAMRTSLDSIAVQAKVRVVEVKGDTTVEQLDAGFLTRKYRFIIEGQYLQVYNFVAGLEQTNNYYGISNLAIERIDDNTGRSRAQFTMRVLTVPEQKTKVATPPLQPETDATSKGMTPEPGIGNS